MARNPQQVADSQCPQRLREHGPEPRMAVIPAEAIAVLAGCPIPLVLADVIWPYDLARSPLLYANPTMLDLLSSTLRKSGGVLFPRGNAQAGKHAASSKRWASGVGISTMSRLWPEV
jgi:hypothetical protein